MCHRCQWPFTIEVDEDQSDESYTSDFRSPDQRAFKVTTRDLTYIATKNRDR